MKKILAVLCVVFVLLVTFIIIQFTTSNKNTVPYTDTIIKIPTKEITENINGYKAENSSENSADTPQIYYANTKTLKYHLPSCVYAERMDEDRLYICESDEELMSEGYTPCKICNP